MLDIGRTEPHYENHYAKWWIYLTHWSLLACTLQAWLAAFIVTRGLMVDRDDCGSEFLDNEESATDAPYNHVHIFQLRCSAIQTRATSTSSTGCSTR